MCTASCLPDSSALHHAARLLLPQQDVLGLILPACTVHYIMLPSLLHDITHCLHHAALPACLHCALHHAARLLLPQQDVLGLIHLGSNEAAATW